MEAFIRNALSAAKGLVLRLIVHLSAILFAVAFIGTLTSSWSFTYGFAVYLGVVCLVGRSLRARYGAFIPMIAGLLQAALILLTGFGPVLAIFLGGLQSWIQEALIGRKFYSAYDRTTIGIGEWVALAAFALLGCKFLMDGMIGLEVLSVPLLALASLSALWPLAVKRARKNGTKTVDRLREILATKGMLPGILHKPLRELIGHAETSLDMAPTRRLREIFPEVQMIEAVEVRARYAASRDNDVDRLVSAERLFSDLKSLNGRYAYRRSQIPAAERRKGRTQKTNFDEGPFLELIDSIRARAANTTLIVRDSLYGITESAENILDAMARGPSEAKDGARFLNRYLKATETLIDTEEELARGRMSEADMKRDRETLQNLLGRVESAFAAEHAMLLQNDRNRYAAELATLDKLLKMEGQ